MSDQSLLLLLDEVRGKTLRLLQGVSEDETQWSPPALHNHILWHAGHSFVLVESLVMEAMGELPQIPEGWFDIFSWQSDPAHVASYRWPTLAQVIAELTDQRTRLRGMIEALGDEDLSRAARPRQPYGPLRHHSRTARRGMPFGRDLAAAEDDPFGRQQFGHPPAAGGQVIHVAWHVPELQAKGMVRPFPTPFASSGSCHPKSSVDSRAMPYLCATGSGSNSGTRSFKPGNAGPSPSLWSR